MTPSEVDGIIKIVEFVIKTFGVGAAPIAIGAYIYFRVIKYAPDNGAGVAGELRDDMKAIMLDIKEINSNISDMKTRLAVAETRLEERKE
jgi:hypothetical protein